MKKFVFSIMIMFISVFLLVACGDEHEHEYEVSTYDEFRHSITCSCGDNIVEEHKFSEWKIIDEATVDHTGKSERACLVCNHKETKTDPKLDHTHDFGEWKILYEPTVSGPGKLIRVCKEYPDHTQEKSIPTLYRYNNDYEFTIITKPTCTNKGMAKFTLIIDSQTFEFYGALEEEHHELNIYEQNNSTNHKASCVCGYEEYKGHNFNDWKVVKKATCSETGLRVKECNDCGYQKEETIDKLEHTLSNAVVFKEATCTSLGLVRESCKNCDYYIEYETNMKSHSLGATKVITEATCTNIGLVERKCLHCDFVEQKETEMLDHEMGAIDMIIEPTCTNIGESVTKCLYCDYIEKKSYEKLDHVLTDVSIENPTCQKDGIHIKKCINCEQQFNELLQKLEHQESEWITITEATCHEEGLEIKKCTLCDEKLNESIISKLEHTPSELKLVKEATCAELGLKEIRCLECNELIKEELIEKLSHVLTDWQTITVSSCTSEGKKVKVCTECLGEIEVEITSKLEHTQVKKEAKEPTCNEVGNTEGLYCDKCDKVFVGAEELDIVDHIYENGSCKWCKELKKVYVKYYNEEELIDTIEYSYGDNFNVLEFTDESNYIYGWFSSDETIEYNDTFKVLEDLEVYAKCTTIEIKTKEDWQLIRQNPSGNFVILNDINFDGDFMTPINDFTGIINGFNHKINDFTIKNNSGNIKNYGLFKINNGVIKNLNITNITFNSSATDNSSGDFAYGVIAGVNNGNIENCHVLSGTFSFVSTCNNGSTINYYIGGLVGKNTNTINNCSFNLNMNCHTTPRQDYNHADTKGYLYYGGFVGYNSGNITNSYSKTSIYTFSHAIATANCNVYVYKYVGGFVSYNKGLIESCYTRASISGTAKAEALNVPSRAYISEVTEGVFVATNNGKIYSCYSSGEIKSVSPSGGNFGGFIGNNSSSGDIRNCYTNANVNSSSCSTLGGFASVNSGVIQNSYSDNTVTATGSVSYAGGFVGNIKDSGLVQKCFTNSSVNSKGGTAGFFRGTSASESSIYNCFYSSESQLIVNSKEIDRPNEGNAERAWILGILDETYIQEKLYFDSEIWHFTTSTPVLSWEIKEVEDHEVCGICGCVYELKDITKEQTTTYEEIAPTCTMYGYRFYKCSNCDKEITIKTQEATGHIYESDIDDKDICINDALVTYTCKNCEVSYTEEIKAQGHTHNHTDECVDCEYNYIEPTCDSEGLLEYVCDVCKVMYSKVLSISHDYEIISYSVEPTCSNDGTATVICTKCEHTLENYIVEGSRTGHIDLDCNKVCDKCEMTICDLDAEFIEIKTVQELINIGKDAESLNGYYILMNDLDLSGVSWEPIGTKLSPFTGFFDGNSHKISNVPLTSNFEYSGLFGYNNGVITSLNIIYKDNSTFSVKNNSLTFGGICTYNEGTINKCSVGGSIKFNITNTVELAEKGKSLSNTQDIVLGLIAGKNTGYIVGCNLTGTCTITFNNNANLSEEIGHGAVDMVVNAYYLSMTVNATQNVNLGLIAGINDNKISNCSIDFTSCKIDNSLAKATYNKGKWGYLNAYSNYYIGTISSNKNEISEELTNTISTEIIYTSSNGNYQTDILENGKFYHSQATTKVFIYN